MPHDAWLRGKYGRFLTLFAQDHGAAEKELRAALMLAEQLCQVAGARHPHLLDILAAAQAELGQFDAAVATATEALAKVDPPGSSLGKAIAGRVVLYRKSKPYRERFGPL